jgi:hypothetical protein
VRFSRILSQHGNESAMRTHMFNRTTLLIPSSYSSGRCRSCCGGACPWGLILLAESKIDPQKINLSWKSLSIALSIKILKQSRRCPTRLLSLYNMEKTCHQPTDTGQKSFVRAVQCGSTSLAPARYVALISLKNREFGLVGSAGPTIRFLVGLTSGVRADYSPSCL